jgi:decaprenylphospho-beta-D-erythro-pentofuranosid-2-ulose 2-reductase
MMDATRRPQSALVLGGASEIAAAALRIWARGPLRIVHLGVRDPDRPPPIAAELTAGGCQVATFRFEATEPVIDLSRITKAFDGTGDIDVGLLTFGVLGDQGTIEEDPAQASQIVTINATATITTSLLLAREMKKQGHGVIVLMSSVAGQRPRRDNYVYGATKAAVDAHARGLSAALVGSGVEIVLIRPGFVHTKMTEGLAPAPFSVTAERAGASIVRAVQRRQAVAWVPWMLGPLLFVLRLLPEGLWRRLVGRVTERPPPE